MSEASFHDVDWLLKQTLLTNQVSCIMLLVNRIELKMVATYQKLNRGVCIAIQLHHGVLFHSYYKN